MKRRVWKKRLGRLRKRMLRDMKRANGMHSRWSTLGNFANRPWLLDVYRSFYAPSVFYQFTFGAIDECRSKTNHGRF